MVTTEVTPAGVQSLGYTKVCFVTGTLAVAGAVSLATDLTTNGVNLSFYLTPDFRPDVAQNKGTDQRLGSTQTYEALGFKTYTIPDIKYVDDPQSVAAGTAKAKLVEGQAGFFVVRFGILATTDWATTQRVNAYPVTLGGRTEDETGSGDEFSKICYRQIVAVTAAALSNIAVTA